MFRVKSTILYSDKLLSLFLISLSIGFLSAIASLPLLLGIALLCLSFGFVLQPYVTLVLFLITRPNLDIFAGIHFGESTLKINIPALFGVLPLLLITLFIGSGKKLRLDTLGLYMGSTTILLLVSAMATISNFHDYAGIREWIRILSLYAWYVLIYNLTRHYDQDLNRGKFLLWAILISSLLPLVTGFYQFHTHKGMVIEVERIYGTFAHPNAFGIYATTIVGLGLYLFRISRTKFRLLGLLFALMAFMLTMLTVSFGVLIFMGQVLGLIFFFWRKQMKQIAVLLIPLIVLFVALSPYLSSGFGTRWSKISETFIQTYFYTGELNTTNSWSWRIYHWRQMYSYWQDKPLGGWGLNTARFLGSGLEAHNDYVRFLVETGLIGLLLYILFFVIIGIRLGKALKTFKNNHFELRSLAEVCYALFFAMVINSFYANNSLGTTYYFIYFTLLGIVFAFFDKIVHCDKKQLESIP